MPTYLLYFNQQWVPDYPEEFFHGAGERARAVTQEMKDAGVYVFAGGVEEDGRVYTADSTSGSVVVTEEPYAPNEQRPGGFAIVDVPDDETATMWAAKVAEACGWPHEVRRIW